MDSMHVVVVGGGITGLTAAHHLIEWSRREGFPLRCTLLEESQRFGGKIRTYRDESGLSVELGPDSIFTPKPAGMQLIGDLGLQERVIYAATNGGTFISRNGVLHSLPDGMFAAVPADMGAFARTSLISPAGKLRVLRDLLLPGRPLVDDVALGAFLRRRLGAEFVDNVASPLLAGIHAGDIDRLSLDAVAPVLRRLYERYGSLMRGAWMERPRRRPGERPPALFASLTGGLEALVDQLVLYLSEQATLRLGARVRRVRRRPAGSYELMVQTSRDESLMHADAVILAVPSFAAAEVLPSVGIHPGLLRTIRYVSTATVLLAYEYPADVLGLRGTGFLIPKGEHSRFSAVTIVSNKWPGSVTERFGAVVRGYIGRDGYDGWTSLSDQELMEAFARELRSRFGIAADPTFGKVTRWENAMPQYEVGHKSRVRQIEHQLEATPGLFLAGAAYRGMGIPECVDDGRHAANSVTDFLTSGLVANRPAAL